MDSQSKEAQGQGVKKLAKQHLTKKQGVEGGQALRRAQHLTNPSEETHRQRCKHSQLMATGIAACTPNCVHFRTVRFTHRGAVAMYATRKVVFVCHVY
eukprot:COSAG02_NODE_900_length_16073_cov_87.296607_5_plen_98_part_00